MRSLARAALIGVVAAVACTAPAAAVGATITVTTTADAVGADGACGLREAITAANTNTATPGPGECAAGSAASRDTIVLGPGVYVLSRAGAGETANATGDLDIRGDLALLGAGATTTTIDARGIDRAIHVAVGAGVSIDGVTVTGGVAPAGGPGTSGVDGAPGGDGGGILNDGALSLARSRVVGNTGGAGGAGGDAVGGVAPNGVNGTSVVAGAGGAGGSGGIESHGGLTVSDSVVTGNQGGVGGAGGSAAGGATSAGATGADGGDATGGHGGDGGPGGVAGAGATTVVLRSAILDNRSGAGGRGGDAQGGGAAGGGNGGDGGDATGGAGGDGGDGGGILASGTLTVRETTIASNLTASGGRGGAATGGARAGLNRVLGAGVGGAGGDGGDAGGIGVATGTATLTNTTIVTNLTGGGGGGGGGGAGIPGGGPGSAGGAGGAGGRGGGVSSAAALTVSFATITRNGEGTDGTDGRALDVSTPGAAGSTGSSGAGAGAAVAAAGTTTLTRSILSGNGCDIVPPPPDDALGVAFQSPGCPGAVGDPILGPLIDNGGPTVTMRPGPGSAALDRVPVAACPATDQRGARRPGGTACDSGAVELAPPLATTGAPGRLTTTTADVGGDVDTRGLPAEFYVDFGPTTSYGGRTAGVPISGASGPSGVTATLAGLSPGASYHYRLVAIGTDGVAIGADRTLVTPLTPPAAAATSSSLRILGLAISPRTFAPLATTAMPTAATRSRPARGARITVRLSRRAMVLMAVQRPARGRRVVTRGVARCVAMASKATVARAKRCTRYPAVGTVRRQGVTGINRFVFTGRIGRTTLRAGSYRLEATAVDVLGTRSAPVRLTFRVVSAVPAPRRG